MKLIVNGKTSECAGNITLGKLLDQLHAENRRVATMVNDNVVSKPYRRGFKLKPGDRVEILAFAGGG